MKSSPVSARTMNSCEKLPPMLPVSASTARKFSPQRGENTLVCLVHVPVFDFGGLDVLMEAVRVLHDELASRA